MSSEPCQDGAAAPRAVWSCPGKMGPARPCLQPDHVAFGTRWAVWGLVAENHAYHMDVT